MQLSGSKNFPKQAFNNFHSYVLQSLYRKNHSNFFFFLSIQSHALGIQLISLALYDCFSKDECATRLV